MFASLPRKLASPLGLLGDDSKLSFRTQPGGIRKLAEVKNISPTDSYWDQYVLLFDSPSDVFSLISSNDIRRALVESPENVATLIKSLSTRLFTLLTDHTFPSPPAKSVASYASNFLKTASTAVGASTAERNPTKEALNCLRVLQRVLPVVFEAENVEFERKLMWEREEVGAEPDGAAAGANGEGTEETPQFVIEDDEDDEEPRTPRTATTPVAARSQSSPSVSTASKKETRPSLAERLISCTIDLMFCCGFTLPSKIQVDHYKINYVIWERGIGSTIDPGASHAYDQNKVEVLRLLLVLLSKQIYTPPSALLSTPSPYTLALAQQTPRRHVLTVLCSLLNTAMNSGGAAGPGSGGGGTMGIGTVTAALPYNHLVFKGEDVRLTLVGMALQVLCTLADFQSGSARDVLTLPEDPLSAAPTAKTNAFRYFLAKLHRPSDFSFILGGVVGIFEQYMASVNNLLPGSKKPLPHILETIIFFWKMIELNKKFRAYVFESDKGVDVVTYLLCYCMEAKDRPEQHGLCRAISYILQTLSAEHAFNDKLSSPIKMQLPSKWAFQGTAGDFMINSIYTVVATTAGALNSLYPALIIALSNSAPYFKHLSVVSSNKLVSLFSAFANPSFLLADEGHPRLLFFLLEVFNGVLLHHLNENPNLVYAVLRSHKSFEDLGTFTLARGLREIRRVQLAKEEQARRKAGAVKGKNAASADGEEAPEHEKARLLTTESRDALGLSRESPSLLEAGLFRGVDSVDRSGTPDQLEAETDPASSAQTQTQPLVSPTTADPPTMGSSDSPTPPLASEKARGKMRARARSESMDTTSSLERIAAAGIGRNGFVPTQDWVTSWQQGLPLDPILLTISELLPKVQNLQSTLPKSNTTAAIIDLLRSATLQHALPETPPPPARRFLWSESSIIWLTSLIWGEIYVRGMSPLGIWNATNVRLFYVKHTQTQSLQISDAVSSVVGGLGGFLGRGSSESLPSRNRTPR